MRRLVPSDDPRILVDAATSDDAAVFRIADDRALVATVDFFTPIVDDAYDFGRIAAVNALSDVYAMGARPLFALNLVGFPRALLGEGILEEILRGGGEAAREAGVPVLGGHSLDDAEPKFGLCVLGEVHPDGMVTNGGARPGDVLVLTKPIGTGVISTALKAQEAPAEVVAAAVASMTTLNRAASDAMVEAGAHACTDVTGFGLLGHLYKMMRASGTTAVVEAAAVPYLDGARDALRDGYVSGGTKRNLDWVHPHLRASVDADELLLLADAQTSGGLLVVGEVPGYPVVGEVVVRGQAVVEVR